MSSGMGRRCAPSRSSYCITKYGVEALSDCLRFEMRQWGVSVVIVEPGNFVNGIQTPISFLLKYNIKRSVPINTTSQTKYRCKLCSSTSWQKPKIMQTKCN